MTTADRKLIDKAIKKYGDDFWNDPNNNDDEPNNPNRGWIIVELLSILAKDNLDLKVVRKNLLKD